MIPALSQKVVIMSSIFESKPEHPVGPPRDRAQADSRRRAECVERISRLLSALGGGPSLTPAKAGNLPKEVIQEPKTTPDSETSPSLLLTDRTAPGELGPREDARNDLRHSGSSTNASEKKPLEPGGGREQQTNQPTELTGDCNLPNRSTIQELEKPGHLGDSHPNSLPPGGTKAPNSKVMRVAGRIFPVAARTVTLNACPPLLAHRYEMLVLGTSGAQITNAVGLGNLTLTHTPRPASYETINILYTTEPTNGSHRL